MIQRFTCIPTYEYDVLILTNGTVAQVEEKLEGMNSQIEHSLPDKHRLIYLDNFKALIDHLDSYRTGACNIEFKGKIFFMFFDGLKFIQSVISDTMDYYQRCLVKKSNFYFDAMYSLEYLDFDLNKFPEHIPYDKLANCYFYFDSSVFDSEEAAYENSFNYLLTIVNDVLKKINFMMGNIKGIMIDDYDLKGEKIFPIHCLLRNYPRIERIELSSDSSLIMKDLVL